MWTHADCFVQLQGKMIDKIDSNVENIAEYTGEAAVTMDKAADYQKAAWRKKMYFLMIVLGIIVVCILLKIFKVC